MSNPYQLKQLLIDFEDYSASINGKTVKIDHMALDVLKLLIEHAGEAVPNDRIMDHVWGDKPSSPEVIPAAVSRLRKMFKKNGIGSDLITTVHKVGYRFNLPAATPLNPAQQPINRFLFWAPWLLLLISGGAWLWLFNQSQTTHSASQTNHITVQPTQSALSTRSEPTKLFILRHTEKQDDEIENPALSLDGIERAHYWSTVLQHVDLDVVYTTNFKRNQQTANILAKPKQIPIKIYHPMSFEVAPFLQQEQGKNILIIGHSNTIPDMVNRLLKTNEQPPMSHQNYNLLYLVTIDQNGHSDATLLHIEKP